MYNAIDSTERTAKGFRIVFSTIGILALIGGIILGLVMSGGFQFGRFQFEYFAPLTFIIYVFASLLSGFIFIYIGRAVYWHLQCMCLIVKNTEKKEEY